MKALRFLESNGFFCTDCFTFFNEAELHYNITTEVNTKYGTLNPQKIRVKKYCPHCCGTPEIENFSPFAWFHLIAKINYYIKNGNNKDLPTFVFVYKVYTEMEGRYIHTDTKKTEKYIDIENYADAENFIIDIINITPLHDTLLIGIDFV